MKKTVNRFTGSTKVCENCLEGTQITICSQCFKELEEERDYLLCEIEKLKNK